MGTELHVVPLQREPLRLRLRRPRKSSTRSTALSELLSNYRESSELSRINQNGQNAGAGAVTTDPEMMDFLEQSEHWSRASNGAFDITVGRLMKPGVFSVTTDVFRWMLSLKIFVL